jgi:hypothetical protein
MLGSLSIVSTASGWVGRKTYSCLGAVAAAEQTCAPAGVASAARHAHWVRPCPVAYPSSAQAGLRHRWDPRRLGACRGASAGLDAVPALPWDGPAVCLAGACRRCGDSSLSSSCPLFSAGCGLAVDSAPKVAVCAL